MKVLSSKLVLVSTFELHVTSHSDSHLYHDDNATTNTSTTGCRDGQTRFDPRYVYLFWNFFTLLLFFIDFAYGHNITFLAPTNTTTIARPKRDHTESLPTNSTWIKNKDLSVVTVVAYSCLLPGVIAHKILLPYIFY